MGDFSLVAMELSASELSIYDKLSETIDLVRQTGHQCGMSEKAIEKFVKQLLEKNEPQRGPPRYPLLMALYKGLLTLGLILLTVYFVMQPYSPSPPETTLSKSHTWGFLVGHIRLLSLPIAKKYMLEKCHDWWELDCRQNGSEIPANCSCCAAIQSLQVVTDLGQLSENLQRPQPLLIKTGQHLSYDELKHFQSQYPELTEITIEENSAELWRCLPRQMFPFAFPWYKALNKTQILQELFPAFSLLAFPKAISLESCFLIRNPELGNKTHRLHSMFAVGSGQLTLNIAPSTECRGHCRTLSVELEAGDFAVELSWSLTDDDKRLIVEMHNHYRSQVSPRAADMLKMSWAPDLEAFAKAYAAKCIWGHNKERGRRGENLFAITDEMDVEVALEQWYNEHEHYNLTTSKCTIGQMCGHYTQVVWANSERVGCGMQFCKTLHGVEEPDLYLLVCNYDPPGNVRGRKPYKEGPPCSKCPEGYTCRNSICEPSVDSEEASTSSRTTRPNLITRPALATATMSPTTTATITPPPTTVKKRLAPTTTTRPAPTTTSPTTTTLGPAPTTTIATTRSNPTTTTRLPPTSTPTTSPPSTRTARPNPTTATGPTSSLEPTSDLDRKTSPEMQVDSEETGAPLVTLEAVTFLDLELTLSPTASPEMEEDLKESDATSVRAEPALSSEPPPSFSLTTLETNLSLEDTKQPRPALKPAPATAKEISLLHLLPPSKAAGGHSLPVQSSLSGARETEELMTGPTKKDLDQQNVSATSNLLEFSLFLVAAPLLTGLLL
ncbi:bombesin receptor-activated protein C6orf89 homolog isoform X3 [Mauremys reevesii]|uniref:bombesin receptor-activated protein C6orf89 homolog isoform X3 n=1 Tax=Mauremys reevesii TaxID=260615 RepID=UPI00193F2545|nr:bombesin receptor-activated protein C6orf89 homolog isoform X3 [Mauremys reevesii]